MGKIYRMGNRKKRPIKLKIDTQKHKEKEEKSKTNNTTSFSYRGEINVKKYKNDKVINDFTIHNSGNWNMFNMFCRLLAGGDVSSLVPGFLDVEDDNGNSKLYSYAAPSNITYEIAASNEETFNENSSTIVFTFGLYGDNLRQTGGTKFVFISERGRRAAQADVKGFVSPDYFDLALDEMLLLTWTLTFGNGEITEEA